MPSAEENAAAMQAAGQVSGQAINALSVAKSNKKDRAFMEHMYQIQNADALTNWNRQNEYNSPQAQMRRYQEAGLNKNLIYGQSNEAAPIKTSDFKEYHETPLKVDPSTIGDTVNTYFNVQQQKAAISNMKKQQEVADSTIALNNARVLTEMERPGYINQQKLASQFGVKYGEQKMAYDSQLQPYVLEAKQQLVKDIAAGIKLKGIQGDYLTGKNTRENKLLSFQTNKLTSSTAADWQKIKESDALLPGRREKLDSEILLNEANELLKKAMIETEPERRTKLINEAALLQKKVNYYELEGGMKYLNNMINERGRNQRASKKMTNSKSPFKGRRK